MSDTATCNCGCGPNMVKADKADTAPKAEPCGCGCECCTPSASSKTEADTQSSGA